MNRVLALALCLMLAACQASAPEPAPQDPARSSAGPEQEVPEALPVGLRPASALGSDDIPGAVPLIAWSAAEGMFQLRLVDPRTGQPAADRPPIALGGNIDDRPTASLSPDGRRLAALGGDGNVCEPSAGGSACRSGGATLRLIDLQRWETQIVELPSRGWAWPLVFQPDGNRIALAFHSLKSSSAAGQFSTRLLLFDVQTGAQLGERQLDLRPDLLAFSGDGTSLIVFGSRPSTIPGVTQPEPPRVQLIEADSMRVRWDEQLGDVLSGSWCLENCESPHEQRLQAYWSPAVVPSSDGGRLYIVHADRDQLTTVDLVNQRVSSVDIRPARTWLERLLALTAGVAEAKGATRGGYKSAVLSPDGARLYVLGRSIASSLDDQGQVIAVDQRSLGLQVVELDTGMQIMAFPTEADRLRFSTDGASLLLIDWIAGRTDVLEPESLALLAGLSAWEILSAQGPEGKPVLLAVRMEGAPQQWAALDPEHFTLHEPWSVGNLAAWLITP